MTARDEMLFSFRTFQVDRSWYKRYWETDPPPPRRELFVGALFLIMLAVSMVIVPIATKMSDPRMQQQTLQHGPPAYF